MKPLALVVGAAGGVGLEVVKRLLVENYRVIGTVLNQSEADRVRTEAGDVDRIVILDMANADSVVAELQALPIETLNAVVVAAAISPYGPLETSPLANLRRTIEINTVSGLAVYQACIPLLRKTRGRFLLISSFAGRVGLPFIGHYVASKFALEGLGDVMRREARVWGVDVILVEPGGIKTPMVTGQIATIDRDRAALTPEVRALYGDLYEGFSDLLKKGWETGIAPSMVADTIIEALKAEHPQARYAVGEDSKFLCDVARKPDEEIDAILKAFAAT